MPKPFANRSRKPAPSEAPRPKPQPFTPPRESRDWPAPWVQLRYPSLHPHVFASMVGAASPDATAGQLVQLRSREGTPCGAALYNPKARIPLRVVHRGDEPVGEEVFTALLDRAIDLRLETLRLPEVADAFRVVHSDADGLGGLIVDRYGDVLSIDCHSLGVYQRLPAWIEHLHRRLGTSRAVVEVERRAAQLEYMKVDQTFSTDVRTVRIREHGVKFEVDFQQGHKTGFFCDQRENRRRLAEFVKGARVLDLCCYTGGFALSAAVNGGAAEVTGVDLDEKAIEQAKRNANLNQARVKWVHADAFAYARQMIENGETFDVVVLDPPKLVHDKDDAAVGRRKYEDLNGLGARVLKPGGLLVTCSCSGQVSAEEFEQAVCRGAHEAGRLLQILDRTGPGWDHPVMSNCPESKYLKVVWAKVW